MITRVLAQVIEDLCILQNRQEFIELSLNESLWNVVCSESSPEFVLCDNMTSRLHGVVMVPPYAGSAAKLLYRKECLVRI
jgi:hypothetical protein